jgi:hypothetical protein
MKVNLQAAGLWDVIESGADDYRDDRTALAAILRAVPPKMQAGLVVRPTASDVWEAIRQVHVGADRIKEANAERLRRDFADIDFKPGESVEDFSLWLNAVTSQLRVLGDDISDKEVIKKMLHVVPDKLEQAAISMETLLDLGSMSIEEAVGMLCAVETRKKKLSPVKEGGGRLLLIEEEWMARMKSREGSGSNSGAWNSGGGKGADKSKGDKSNPVEGRKSSVGRDNTCNYCGKKVHWAKECRKKKRDEAAQAHLAQGEEKEHNLLMAHSIILNPRPPASSTPPPHRAVHIHEQKVFADLGSGEQQDRRRWVLDTGATNHMMGSKEIFAELDTQIYDTFKFGDGSITNIEGWGTIILTYKNGEHHTLTGVYYIPQLKASILSIGQRDETSCRVDINGGIMRIFDQHSVLLAKVAWDDSRLYYLDLVVGRPVCLTAHASEAAWQWHTRYRHLNFGSLRKLAAQRMVRGLPELTQMEKVCDSCLVGKQCRAPFPA